MVRGLSRDLSCYLDSTTEIQELVLSLGDLLERDDGNLLNSSTESEAVDAVCYSLRTVKLTTSDWRPERHDPQARPHRLIRVEFCH